MVNIIGVRFENAGKLYYFDAGSLWPVPGDFVVVETTRGIEFGEVVAPVQEMDDSTLTAPMKKVVRVASAADVQHNKENKAAEKEAYAICQHKIAEHKLDMKLVSVEYTFDNNKILFYFTANGRVDFRSLVKDLASVFRTRIELRQIGVRDEAKMIGGLGPCGRPICCAAFLGDFQPVSIKMAKEQNLSLNPIKISGVCGRLMCCLKYEEDTYEETRRRMPRVGRDVVTPDGTGTVVDLNVIRETVKVRLPKGEGFEFKDYPLADVQRPNMPAGQTAQAQDENDGEMQEQAETEEETAVEATVRKPAPVERKAPAVPQKERTRAPQPESVNAPTVPAGPSSENRQPEQANTPKKDAGAWKAALEKAMKAAHQEGQEEKPAALSNESHAEPETSPDSSDDEIL